jgi:hypothetical protein
MAHYQKDNLNENFQLNQIHTSLKGELSASSMCTIWLIFCRFCALGLTQRNATRRARFNALKVGFSGSLGSNTPSGFLLLTILLSQSIKFT